MDQPHSTVRARLRALLTRRPELSTTQLALIVSLFSSAACNGSLWGKLLALPAAGSLGGWGFRAGMFVLVTALQFIILSLLLNRWTAKPLLTVMFFLTGATVYFMNRFGIYVDSAMAQNFLETDFREARDLLAWNMLPYIAAYMLLPWALLWRIRIRQPPLRKSWHHRPLALLAALAVVAVSFYPISKQLMPLMREQKTLRYLITPSNYLYSLARVTLFKPRIIQHGPRTVVAPDAVRPPQPPNHKPLLLVMVVGETTRAANWGLNGYARQTTPELAARQVINFPDVTSCGTNTATSLPCMFSIHGRRHYDEDQIRGSESVLNVLQRTGIRVLWRDNQSGCKGVCEGVEEQVTSKEDNTTLCRNGECFDEILLHGLEAEVGNTVQDMVVVLHQMGLHGPAYYQRYPQAFRRFTPTCDTTQLETCTQAQITNTYDNGVLYTDHVVAGAIDYLKTQSATRRTALIYVSDHGESLGENGMYLHSIPFSIAPSTQTHVPMVMWFGNDLTVRDDCMRQRAQQAATHDNLFHTLLGIAGVKTSVYEAAMDLTAGCRPAS
jgi:lipid A ethanolaminephosphotransferase